MEKTFYKGKAQSIKNAVVSIRDKGEIVNSDLFAPSYPGIEEAKREFIHLVYSFDPKLPLNVEIESLKNIDFTTYPFGEDTAPRGFKTFIEYIDFFLHYLDVYVE